MADTFLSPMDDYAGVAEFCGVTDLKRVGFRRAVDAAAAAVRNKCGPVLLVHGLTHTTRQASTEVVFPFRVAELASVADLSGSALTPSDFHADPHHLDTHGGQVVRRVDGGTIAAGTTFYYSSGWYYDALPADLVGAGYEIARQLWRSQLGNQRTGDDQQARTWSVQVLADRYIPSDWLLAPLGFA